MDHTQKPGVDDPSLSDYHTACVLLFEKVQVLNILHDEHKDAPRVWDKSVLMAAIRMDEGLIALKNGTMTLDRSVQKINQWAGKVRYAIKVNSYGQGARVKRENMARV